MTRWLRHLLPRPRLFAPRGRFAPGPPAGLAILSPGPLPSTDYYFRTRLQARGEPEALWLDTRAQAPASLPPQALDGRLAVLVRHAPSAWLERLEKDAPRLAGAVFFLDDDLPGAAWDPWLPRRYALRTSLRFLAIRGRLGRLCGQIWAATPALARRYPEARARLLPPLALDLTPDTPPAGEAERAGDGPLTVFYHGTAAHGREKRWLAEVLAKVRARRPDLRFEVSGGPDVAALYAGLPGVAVLPPLPWPEFRARLGREPRHIGLAPLLDSPFNATRSHTKFLEITRCGAAGIYSRREPYAGVVEHGASGLLAGDDPAEWAEAVLRLAGDAGLRAALFRGARRWCLEQPARWPWEAA